MIENACLNSYEHKAELNPQEAAITKRFGMGENDFATMTRWRKRFGRKDPGLVHALPNDANLIVRHEAAAALSSIGDGEVLPQLGKAIGDSDEDVSNSAQIAFEYLAISQAKASEFA